MAEKMTEIKALENVLAGNIDEPTLEKIKAMLTTRLAAKDRPRKKDDSKRLANIAAGEEFAKVWTEETFKASDVADVLHVSPQRASAIIKAKEWEVVPTTEKVNVYKF